VNAALDIVAKTRIAATSARIDAAEAPAAIWTLMRFRQHCGTAAPPRVMLLFWLIFGTVHAADITTECAAAFRLTLKGYVSNGKDPAEVCSPPPTTCRRPAGIYQCINQIVATRLVLHWLIYAQAFITCTANNAPAT